MSTCEALSTGPGIWRPGSCCVNPGTGPAHSGSFCVIHGHVGSLLCFIQITFLEDWMRKGLQTLCSGEVACSKWDPLKPMPLKPGKAARSGCGAGFLPLRVPGRTAVPEFSGSGENPSCLGLQLGCLPPLCSQGSGWPLRLGLHHRQEAGDTKRGLTWSLLGDEGGRTACGRQAPGRAAWGTLLPFSGALCLGSLGWKFQMASWDFRVQ